MNRCFEAFVLKKHAALYEMCNGCNFLRARNPTWLAEAYSSAIAAADTGLVMRNISVALKISSALFWLFGERGEGPYLDAAGGYGMLVRMMRDAGFNFYWSDRYCENLMARGFEYSPAIGSCRTVTAIEVMEHLTDPLEFVASTLQESGAESLIFTTELHEGFPPKQDWWYYTFPTGQHVAFYSYGTLVTLGHKLGLNFISANGLHVLSRKHMSLRKLRWATNPVFARVSSLMIRRLLGSRTWTDHLKMLG